MPVQQIDILAIVDVGNILSSHSNLSQDPNTPSQTAHYLNFLIQGSRAPVSGQATFNIGFGGYVDDTVSLRAMSTDQNSDTIAIVYGMQQMGGGNVFSPFVQNQITNDGATPDSQPPYWGIQNRKTFTEFTSRLVGAGVEQFQIQLALYDREGPDNVPVLKGYCWTDPMFSVTG